MRVSRRRRGLFAAAVLQGVLLAASAAAQTSTPARAAAGPDGVPGAKIAVIDTVVFADDKGGITRYVSALKLLGREFPGGHSEWNILQARVKALVEEISKAKTASPANPMGIQAKQDEVERLQREIDQKKEAEDALLRKRFSEVVGPIAQDIRAAIDQFAAQRGITMLLDKSRLDSAILAVNPAADVTQEFVADFNSKNPPPGAPPAPR